MVCEDEILSDFPPDVDAFGGAEVIVIFEFGCSKAFRTTKGCK